MQNYIYSTNGLSEVSRRSTVSRRLLVIADALKRNTQHSKKLNVKNVLLYVLYSFVVRIDKVKRCFESTPAV